MFRMEWAGQAACTGTGVETWYDGDSRTVSPNEQTLRRVCSSCPVQMECQEHAVMHERWGFWGGMSAAERARLRRKRNLILDDSVA